MKKFTVYEAWCAELLKRYVGMTSTSVEHRRGQHEAKAAHYAERPFYRALSELGAEAFVWRALYVDLTEPQAIELEAALIALDKSRGASLNVADGSTNAGLKHTEETRRKLSRATSAWFAERPHEAVRVSRALGGTAVIVLKNGEVVNEFETQHEAARTLGLYVSNINHCLSGKLRSTGGYQFRRKS